MSGIPPVAGSATAGFGHNPYPGGGTAADEHDRRRSTANWQRALDELEGDVLEAQSALARGRAEEIAAWGRRTEDWVPPADLGPIPTDLRERAAQLLQHQLAVAEQLVERILQSQRQRDVAARMSYAPSRPVASFVDRAL
ncbi:hypothetical protein [Blastococcus saxobsidens]|uniref:Uncharacterized protein n=1 Tax=Blastococcus saxobsidens (strain DD2) TaxID=1146883 RepID=H6RTE2_BLASD|nr:hypothetical protein [Blastococcus saxobsidens]CCG01800.1 conserved protein of unknown function; putative coiled-coil domain [Blastococcus saxobsidens DD2]